MLFVLIVDLGTQYVEPGAGAGIVSSYGLIERDLGGGKFRVDGFDACCVCDAEEVGVAYGEDDEVAGVFCGEAGAFKVVLCGDVVFQCGDVEEILCKVGAEVDDLKGADDGIEAGKLQAEGGEVDLLDLDAAGGVDGWQKRL